MSEHILDQRRRALEELFFAKENERLRQELRHRYDHATAKKTLMRAAGIHNEQVIEHLLDSNISADTLAALRVIPLLQTAWADGELDDREQKAILDWAQDQEELDQESPSGQLLEAWVHEPPSRKLFGAWKQYVAALYRDLPVDLRNSLKREVIESVRRVAAASGGVLGLGKVAESEREMINEIEAAFEQRGSRAFRSQGSQG